MNTLRTLFLILGFILSFSINSIGQTTLIDSLQQLLQQEGITSEKKSTIYYQLAAQFVYVNPSKTIFYAYKSLAIVGKENYKTKGMIYNVLAAANAEKSNFDIAIQQMDTALLNYKKIDDKGAMADIYNNIGGIYGHQYQYSKAATFWYKSLKIYDALGMQLEKAVTLNNLIGINIYLKNYEEGLKNAFEAIQVYENHRDSVGAARTKFNVAIIYLYLDKYEDALSVFNEIIPFFDKMEQYDMQVISYIKKGWVLNKLGQDKLALESLEQALELKKYINSKNTLIELYNSQASLLFEVKMYPKSIQQYQISLDSAKSSANYHYQQEALNGLIKNYKKIGNFEKATALLEESLVVRDTILSQNNQERLKELEVKYETEKTTLDNILLAKERDFQKLEATRSKQLFYITLVVLLLLLVLSFLLIRQYKANANHLTSQLKFQLLRNQMNPHFLFNALVAIQSFVYENKPLEAGDYLSSFATLMRAILDNSMQEYISTEKELEWLENYLSLQLLRFDNRFEYSITVDKNISLKDTFIPPMLIQPFVENALEHGLKNLEHKGKIEVRLHLVNGQLQIDVQDNGVGFDANHKTKKNHLSHALNITKERLAFLNKKLTNKIFFEIQSEVQKGTLISFAIPFRNEK